jgi:two-component system nitrate/nitrite response regulator NarL
MTFRVLLADDYPVVREGFKRLLDVPGLSICGGAGNGKEALEQIAALKPDLVLMDLTMPEMNGIEATREIRRRFPKTRVIIVSLHDSARVAPLIKGIGADAYVAKTTSAEELLETIQSVMGLARSGGTGPGRRGALKRSKKVSRGKPKA